MPSEKFKKNINISLIGLDGVGGKALFRDQVAEIERSCGDELG